MLNFPDPLEPAPTSRDEKIKKVTYDLSPVQLRAAGYIYGMESVPLAAARVLQLECGAGDDLIPFAIAYPKSHVVGVGSSAEDIGRGRALAESLGVGNLELILMDWEQVRPDFGRFDYIIGHGLHGRIPADSSQALLRICRENLTPFGLALIDYRTYPGWKAADILRDAIAMHVHGATTDAELLGKARGVLSLMAEGVAEENPYAATLKDLIHEARGGSDDDLVRDYLLGSKTACYYAEFADLAARSGLACVGDAQPHREIATAFGNHVGLTHALVSLGKSTIVRQQYLDFAVGRKTRQSVLVHAERGQQVLPAPEIAKLKECRLTASLVRVQPGRHADKDARVYQCLSGGKGGISVMDNTTIAVIESLSHAWPATLTFAQLVVQTKNSGVDSGRDETGHEQAVLKALEQLLHKGVLRYAVDNGPCDRPEGSGLRFVAHLSQLIAAGALAEEKVNTFNLWHEPVELVLSDMDRYLLPRIDERRDFKAVVAGLTRAYRDGVVTPVGNLAAMDDDALSVQATVVTASLYDRLKRHGVLFGPHRDWQAYLASALVAAGGKGTYWHTYLDALALHSELAVTGWPAAAKATSAKGRTANAESHKDYIEAKRLYELNRWVEAEAITKTCTERFPENPTVWHMYGDILRHLGKLEEAKIALLRSISCNPRASSVHAALGLVVQALGLADLAESCYRRALLLDPDSYSAHTNLSIFLKEQGRYAEAEAHARRAAEIRPKAFEAYTNLGNVLSEDGRLHEALEMHRRALDLRPSHMPSFSNLLFTLTHLDDIEPEEVFRTHASFGDAVLKSVREPLRPHLNDREPERKLRVGFVSADLRNHAVSNFLEPVWANLDRDALDIYVYSNNAKEDKTTARLKGYAQAWRSVVGMTDAELARAVREDAVDVLFDLSGHTGENRLPAFAYKPAPVQVSWIGYPATTGMSTMDYYLTDKYVAPPGRLDDQFSEKLVYLSSTATFRPFDGSPAVNPLPAQGKGYFTFGSFNRPNKIGDITLRLWVRVLKEVPTARMLLGGMASKFAEDSIAARLGEHGIDRDRLVFRQRASMVDYLQYHHDVDLILDTFPYTGGTTTNHALWMGVPVMTMRGRTWVSGQTASALGGCGLHEQFVTDSPDAFVENAVAWTQRLPELAQLRADLRNRMLNAPGRDYRNVARCVEGAIRRMWRRWCNGESPASFVMEP